VTVLSAFDVEEENKTRTSGEIHMEQAVAAQLVSKDESRFHNIFVVIMVIMGLIAVFLVLILCWAQSNSRRNSSLDACCDLLNVL